MANTNTTDKEKNLEQAIAQIEKEFGKSVNVKNNNKLFFINLYLPKLLLDTNLSY